MKCHNCQQKIHNIIPFGKKYRGVVIINSVAYTINFCSFKCMNEYSSDCPFYYLF
jgi:hypothetical protein